VRPSLRKPLANPGPAENSLPIKHLRPTGAGFHRVEKIARAIKARRLTQQGAAELLGVDQSKVSRITRGQFRGISEAKLLELVTKLGHDVKIVVGPVRRRAGKIELQFA
jgi:predicted XRE-type DNA-binding protein